MYVSRRRIGRIIGEKLTIESGGDGLIEWAEPATGSCTDSIDN